MPTSRSLVALVLALCALDASAGTRVEGMSCDVHSDYDLSVTERSIVMTRESGTPRTVLMRQGRLFVDEAWVALSAADTARVGAFEDGVRAAMPEAQAVGREAADIAFTALGSVAAGLSDDPAAVQARLARARVQLDQKLGRSVTATRFDGRDLGDGIGEAVGEMVPMIVGDLVGGALSAAFSGDASRLKRLENLDAQIEAQVRPRTQRLEQRAARLCTRMVELDRIDASLDYRLPGGAPLNLLDARARPQGSNAAAR